MGLHRNRDEFTLCYIIIIISSSSLLGNQYAEHYLCTSTSEVTTLWRYINQFIIIIIIIKDVEHVDGE